MVLGNTFASAGLLAVAFWMVMQAAGHCCRPSLSCLLILFACEVLPKTLAVRAPNMVAVRCARPILFLDGSCRSVSRRKKSIPPSSARLFRDPSSRKAF